MSNGPMTADELLVYCIVYQRDIFVRWEGRSIAFADLSIGDALTMLRQWLMAGHTPVRVIGDPELGDDLGPDAAAVPAGDAGDASGPGPDVKVDPLPGVVADAADGGKPALVEKHLDNHVEPLYFFLKLGRRADGGDVSGTAGDVLRKLGAADCLVISGGAVAADNPEGLAKLISDTVEHRDEKT